jgi:hypothetical protein
LFSSDFKDISIFSGAEANIGYGGACCCGTASESSVKSISTFLLFFCFSYLIALLGCFLASAEVTWDLLVLLLLLSETIEALAVLITLD